MSGRNKQIVVDFLEAFARGDVNTAMAFVAPDAMAITKGYGKLSGPRDRQAIHDTIAGIGALAPNGLKATIHSAMAEGDRAVIEFEVDGVLVNGARYRNQYCMVFTLRDGQIIHLNEYCCTVHADEVLGPFLTEPEKEPQA
jgi:ketosteroid isomerase-like protein